MHVLVASAVVLVVAVSVIWWRLPQVAVRVLREGSAAVAVMGDGARTDTEKEAILRSSVRTLVRLSAVLVAGNVVSLALPFLAVVVLDRVTIISAAETFHVLIHPGFLALAIIVLGAVGVLAWHYSEVEHEVR
jgi:hypothetical protein